MTNYLLENVKSIQVEDGTIIEGSIEIREGRIAKLRRQGIDTPAGLGVVDGKGAYVIPGLIDMHCHIKEGTAPLFVASGVTTIRNTAGNVLLLKDLIDAAGDAPTPRIYSADRMIDGPPGLWGPSNIANFVTEDPEAARKEVGRQAEAGADFIKVYGWIGKDVLEAVVDEANRYGLSVSSDLLHAEEINALEAAEMGVEWFEHAAGFAQVVYPDWYMKAEKEVWEAVDWTLPDEGKIRELSKQMIALGAKLCPTIVTFDQIQLLPHYWNPRNPVSRFQEEEHGFGKHWRELEQHEGALRDQLGFYADFVKSVTRIYHELGGTVVAGTDSPAGVWTYFGMALHRELEIFRELGLSHLEVLQSATLKAAASIGLEDVGSIKKGNLADLVLLRKNPLEDIKNTQSIDRVIKGGRVFTVEELVGEVMPEDEEEARMRAFEKEFEEFV